QALGIFMSFYASQVALLVDKLKSTVDAHGNPLLDSTLVVWVSELGGSPNNQDQHQTGDVPVIVFDHGQGGFKPGRHLRGKPAETVSEPRDGAGVEEAGRAAARLLVSVMQYMGLSDVTRVGRSDAKGPLLSLYA